MRILLLDKDKQELTTLFKADFRDLSYDEGVESIGACQFTMLLGNDKATPTNLKGKNWVEVREDTGELRWHGIISTKNTRRTQVIVNCREAYETLQNRRTPDDDIQQGTVDTVVADILNTTNTAYPTGITLGSISLTDTVDLTFNRSRVYDAIKTVVDSVDGQYRINKSGELEVAKKLGRDLSTQNPPVIFRYEINVSNIANILDFNVLEDDTKVVTKAYGKSKTNTSTQEDTDLTDEFGLQEQFSNFREVNDSTTLDGLTSKMLQGTEFIPNIDLDPKKIEDNFETFDTIRLKLKNKLVDIDQTYQITRKQVRVIDGEKRIRVDISRERQDFAKEFSDLKKNVELMERET